MRYKLCVIMYGGGRAMYPGRGSFLLGSAVVGDGGRGSGGGVQVCAPRICGRISDRSKNKLVVFDVPYPLLRCLNYAHFILSRSRF